MITDNATPGPWIDRELSYIESLRLDKDIETRLKKIVLKANRAINACGSVESRTESS